MFNPNKLKKSDPFLQTLWKDFWNIFSIIFFFIFYIYGIIKF